MTSEQNKRKWIAVAVAVGVILLTVVVILVASNPPKEQGDDTNPPETEGSDTQAPDRYVIRFRSWDGTVLDTQYVKPGEIPVYGGNPPTRQQDETYRYEFIGWDEELLEAASDRDYYAKFQAIERFPLWDGSIASGFESGSGTQDDPYLIANASQLAYLAKAVNENNSEINREGVHFRQINDINLASENNAHEWTPIGTGVDLNGSTDLAYAFKGYYNGYGFRILGMTITQPARTYHKYFGLFGAATGQIAAVNLENVNISLKNSPYVAGVCGYYSSATYSLVQCTVSGTITGGTQATGGIVAVLQGNPSTVGYSSSSATVSGGYMAGGITGYSNSGIINHCTSSGSVSVTSGVADSGVGGIVGYSTGRVWYCSSSASVSHVSTRTEAAAHVGGLVGLAWDGFITGCSATGSLSTGYSTATSNQNSWTGQYVGGLVGHIRGTTAVKDSFSLATVSSDGFGGGFVGSLGSSEAKIENCYAAGTVSAKTMAGGFVAAMNDPDTAGLIKNCVAFGDVTATQSGQLAGFYPAADLSSSACVNCYRAEYQAIHTNYTVSSYDNASTPKFATELNTDTFWTNTLTWSEETWDLSELDVEGNKYPKLK